MDVRQRKGQKEKKKKKVGEMTRGTEKWKEFLPSGLIYKMCRKTSRYTDGRFHALA
jgi:hypothetical protein